MTTLTVNRNGHDVKTMEACPSEVEPVQLRLMVSDPDLHTELIKRKEPDRSEFALSAMKIGIIAFRQAQGQVDAAQVHLAGDRVIADMSATLERHQQGFVNQVGDCIREYFDPKSGQFTQRVRSLIGQGEDAGELERIIRQQVEGDGSLLVKTLAAHVGDKSPLMQILDPQSTNGLLALLTQATEDTLSEQRERILSEFSLDNQGSALGRLVLELQKTHGDVGRALERTHHLGRRRVLP